MLPIALTRLGLVLPFFLQLASAAPAPQESPCPPSPLFDRTHDKLGAVSSESKTCSQIGIDMLKLGGNAADSTIATVFCVGVQAPYHSGLGGGGFMLVRGSNGSYEFIDFRETAPAASTQEMYTQNASLSLYGGLASGIPGELRGLEYLHKHYGSLPWATLMAPAIKLARYGYPVGRDLVNYMASATAGQDNFLVNNPTWALDFAPNGTLLSVNQTITRRRYADTLETISMHGASAFYTGAIARTTIKTLQATGGIMTLGDLANYTIAIRKPSQITYRGYRITSCSAPSGGEVALSVMKTIEGYPDIGQAATVNISTHRLDEAMRFAYGERSNLGDPRFLAGLQSYEDNMISAATAALVRSKITDVAHNRSYYDPSGLATLTDSGTSAVTAADVSGMSIALTTTVNTLFGSQVMIPETGVIMNNEMNDFSIPGTINAFGYSPSPANYIVPGKRPLSSISPTIVEHLKNSSLYYTVASAGGSRIITAVIQNLWHVLDGNYTAAAALAAPRLHDQLSPVYTSFEYAYDNATVAYMRSVGHNITFVAPGGSTAQSLRRFANGSFEAAGEPRQLDSAGLVI